MRVLLKEKTVTYFSESFARTLPPLDAGDRVMCLGALYTLGNEYYERGDVLEVIERTDEAPYGRITTEGNLRIRGKNGQITVWSNVEWMIALGHMARVL